jgi:VWFA-related protein
MRTKFTTARVVLGVAAAALTSSLVLAAARRARSQEAGQSQDSGQSQEGPKKSAGEPVLAPKKAPNAPPAAEKQPEKINPADIPAIRTTTSLVNVDVLVVDKDGNPIPSLGKKNFKIYDDGVEQTVTNFGTGEAPMTAVLLLEFANEFWVNVYNALRYSYTFLNYIQPNDWVAVIDFDIKPHILLDFTHDRSEVESALDQERIPGFSEICLYDALAFTIDRMKDIQGRKAIIPVCTGIDTFSKLTYGKLLNIVKTSDTPIYPVSILEWLDVRRPYGPSFSAEVAKSQLQYIAQYSGGQAYFPRFVQDVPSVYQQIAGQLRTEYSIGFVPSNPARDGKFHKLKVELVDEQGNALRITNQKGKQVKYKLVSRDGYYAPKS